LDAAFKLSGCCESQRKAESIHSPETCLPGSGWEFKKAGTVTIPLPAAGAGSTNQRFNDSTITVNRAVMEKGAYKQLSYFWFPMRGRVLTNAWDLKLYNFWDALTRQRTDQPSQKATAGKRVSFLPGRPGRAKAPRAARSWV
jgi:EpsI family protein